MSTVTKSFDTALDFLPAEKRAGKGVVATFLAFATAISDGLAASREYHRLTEGGVPPAEAIKKVNVTHFAAN